MSPSRAERAGLEFLKRRLASAIARGDDPTALRLSRQLDRAINGPLARREAALGLARHGERDPAPALPTTCT